MEHLVSYEKIPGGIGWRVSLLDSAYPTSRSSGFANFFSLALSGFGMVMGPIGPSRGSTDIGKTTRWTMRRDPANRALPVELVSTP